MTGRDLENYLLAAGVPRRVIVHIGRALKSRNREYLVDSIKALVAMESSVRVISRVMEAWDEQTQKDCRAVFDEELGKKMEDPEFRRMLMQEMKKFP